MFAHFWIVPETVFYRSFDMPDEILLVEGTDQKNFAALLPGVVEKNK